MLNIMLFQLLTPGFIISKYLLNWYVAVQSYILSNFLVYGIYHTRFNRAQLEYCDYSN